MPPVAQSAEEPATLTSTETVAAAKAVAARIAQARKPEARAAPLAAAKPASMTETVTETAALPAAMTAPLAATVAPEAAMQHAERILDVTQVVLGITPVRNGRRVERCPGGSINGRHNRGNRMEELGVDGGASSDGRHNCNCERECHSSPFSETHSQSLFRRSV